MFFGVVLAPGKAFSSTLQHDLMLSQVAIGRTGKKGERSVLELTVEGHKFVVATLRYGEVDQAPIDLHFVAGTSVQLSNPTGTADLHVVGNYIIENDFDMDSDDEGDDEIDSDEFGSDDSDLEFSDDEEEDDDDDDISDDEPQAKRPASKPAAVSDAKRPASKPAAAAQKPESKTPQKPESKTPQKPAADSKTPSKDNKTPVKADSKTPVKAADSKTPESKTPQKPAADSKTPSKDNKTPVKADSKTPVKAADSKTPVKAADSKTPVKAADSKTPVKDDAPKPPADTPVKHPSGLRYLVLKAAPKAAPVAKKGRTVVVSYRGTLNQGGKQFDANKRFEFRLGAGDVIQGWDIGVAGMQVGEKRRLFVPPALGYGKDGVKERGVYVIPRNAPLDFDVELLQIK